MTDSFCQKHLDKIFRFFFPIEGGISGGPKVRPSSLSHLISGHRDDVHLSTREDGYISCFMKFSGEKLTK